MVEEKEDTPRNSTRREAAPPIRKTVYAYGFDKAGFTLPEQRELRVQDIRLELLPYKTDRRIDGADGLILPSGLFESFDPQMIMGRQYVTVECDRSRLLTKYREFENIFRRGGWSCCLVQEIVDQVPQGYGRQACTDTDLVKKILNAFGVRRELLQRGENARHKSDEFKTFIAKWGVARTILLPRDRSHRVLAVAGNTPVGLEFESQVLFLPFHTSYKRENDLVELVTEVLSAVEVYLEKRSVDVPEWVDAFLFENEKRVRSDLAEARLKVRELEEENGRWRGYKGVLVRTGEPLRETVSSLLKGFFGLQVRDQDVGREDLSVLDAGGAVVVVVEVKGTNGGVRREYINQVDSHRERLGLGASVPGVLVINDFMDLSDFDARLTKPVAAEQVQHARRQNTLIVRAVDLLRLMRGLEAAAIPDRAKKWRELCAGRGGLMKETSDGSFVVHGGE